MKYKTLFRLGIKLIGIMQIAQGLSHLALMTASMIFLSTSQWTTWSQYLAAFGPTQVQGLIQIALGLYLFFAGKWITDKAIPGNRPYCPECGYDLTAAKPPNCPECGTTFAKPNSINSTTT